MTIMVCVALIALAVYVSIGYWFVRGLLYILRT